MALASLKRLPALSAVILLTTTIFYYLLSTGSYNDSILQNFQNEWELTTSEQEMLNSHGMPMGMISYQLIGDTGIVFNASGFDVLVIHHIQKTGGTTFERHIVLDLEVGEPCICKGMRKMRCKCPRPSMDNISETGNEKVDPWVFSGYSTYAVCGMHADWTELTTCVDETLKRAFGPYSRKYFYVTTIREPVHRFLSEFRNVQRGATWKVVRHICQRRRPPAEELGLCYSGNNWKTVNLKEFMSCPDNLAINRQTRMLADLSLVGCYNKSYMPTPQRNRIMLASAKRNLEAMAFFGLTEYQNASQYLFEETFKLRFKKPFIQDENTHSKATLDGVSDSDLATIRELNSLDVELYQFGEQLFTSRFLELMEKEKNPNFFVETAKF